MNQINGNETKSDFFHETNSNLTSFFTGCKILKYLNDVLNRHLSISLQKWNKEVKWNKIKQDMCKSGSIFPKLQNVIVLEWLLKIISWSKSQI